VPGRAHDILQRVRMHNESIVSRDRESLRNSQPMTIDEDGPAPSGILDALLGLSERCHAGVPKTPPAGDEDARIREPRGFDVLSVVCDLPARRAQGDASRSPGPTVGPAVKRPRLEGPEAAANAAQATGRPIERPVNFMLPNLPRAPYRPRPYAADSRLSIGAWDEPWFQEIVQVHDGLGRVAGAASTRQDDDRAWREWEAFCLKSKTSAQRFDEDACKAGGRGHRNEVTLALAFLLDAYRRMNSRSARERPAATPASLLSKFYRVQRAHKLRFDTNIVTSVALTAFRQTLERQYAEFYGPEFLLQQRGEPMTAQILARMLDVPNGTRIIYSGPYPMSSPICR
jgi:hypothetical protein